MNDHPWAGELMAGRLWKVSIQHLGESCHSAPAPPDAAPHLAQCRTACRVITTILPPSRHQQVGCGWVVSHSALVTSQTGGWCPTVHWSPHLIAALSLSHSPSLASQQVIFNVIIIVNVGQSNPFRCWQLFTKLITSPVLAGLCLVGSVWHFCRG